MSPRQIRREYLAVEVAVEMHVFVGPAYGYRSKMRRNCADERSLESE